MNYSSEHEFEDKSSDCPAPKRRKKESYMNENENKLPVTTSKGSTGPSNLKDW